MGHNLRYTFEAADGQFLEYKLQSGELNLNFLASLLFQ